MKITFRDLAAVSILIALVIPAFGDGWTTNYAKALEESQTENKPLLLDFTGSDWCEWCMKMDHETLDTGEFHDFANQNLVLVKVDFPQAKPQSDQLKAQNQMLKDKYKISGYPTYVLIGPKGKVRGRQVGYLAGGPKAFIGLLSRWYPAMPGTGASAGAGDDFDSFFKKPAASPAQ